MHFGAISPRLCLELGQLSHEEGLEGISCMGVRMAYALSLGQRNESIASSLISQK